MCLNADVIFRNLIACNAASLEITWHIPLDDVDTLRVQPGVLAVVRGGAQKEIRSIECSDNAAKNVREKVDVYFAHVAM